MQYFNLSSNRLQQVADLVRDNLSDISDERLREILEGNTKEPNVSSQPISLSQVSLSYETLIEFLQLAEQPQCPQEPCPPRTSSEGSTGRVSLPYTTLIRLLEEVQQPNCPNPPCNPNQISLSYEALAELLNSRGQ